MDGQVTIKPEPPDTGYNSTKTNMSTNSRQPLPALQPSPTRPILLAPSRPSILAPSSNITFSQQTLPTQQWNPASAPTVFPLVIQPQVGGGTSLLLQPGTLLQQRMPVVQTTRPLQQPVARSTVPVASPTSVATTTSRTPPSRSRQSASISSRNAKAAASQNSTSSLKAAVGFATTDSIRIGYFGSITVLMYTPIADEEKSMCGLVYAARVSSANSQQEYMCNFCHYKHDRLSTFCSHVASHIFQCNHCAFKSFSRVELIAHKKDRHPEFAPEVLGFKQSLTSNGNSMPSTPANSTAIAHSPSSLISALSTPRAHVDGDSAGKSPAANGSKTTPLSTQSANKQYFTFKLTEFANGYIKALECEHCVFKTSSMGGLMSHATTHRTHEINRDENLVVWECLMCRFASRHKKQVVAHISHIHHDQVQTDDEVRLRKLAFAKTTSVAHEESEGEWLWSCYYCTFNSTDRELVLAHEGLEHRNSKLMITRKKLSTDERMLWGVALQTSNRHNILNTTALASGQTQSTTATEPISITPDVDKSKDDDGAGFSKGGSRRKQQLPKRILDNDAADVAVVAGDQANRAASRKSRSSSPSGDEFIYILVLDHIPEDLKMDVSDYIQYDESSKRGKCLSCNYHGVGSRMQIEEHALQTHILCDIWKCSYCDFRNVRRFGVTRHIRNRHSHLPRVIMRRKPFGEDQPLTLGKVELNYEVIGLVSSENIGEEMVKKLLSEYQAKKAEEKAIESSTASVSLAPKFSGSAPKFRGPKSLCERRLLKLAKKAWLCTYCPRRSVLKSVIYTHMRNVHPGKRRLATLKVVDRHLVDNSAVVSSGSASDIKRLANYDACIRLSLSDVDEDSRVTKNREDLLIDSDFSLDSLAMLGVEIQQSELAQGRRHSLRNLAEHRIEIKREPERERSSSRSRDDRVSKRFSQRSLRPEVSKTMHQCAYCDELNGLFSLRRHLKEIHTDVEPKVRLPGGRRDNYQYMCPLLACSFVSSTKKVLYLHLDRHPLHSRSAAYGKDDDGAVVLEQERANESLENDDVIQFDDSHEDDDSEAEAALSEREDNSEDDWQPGSKRKRAARQMTTRKRNRLVSDEELSVDVLKSSVESPRLKAAEPQGQSNCSNDQKQLGCSYCTFETWDIFEIKEHLTSSHTHKEAVAVDLLVKKSSEASKIYLCPLLFCNSQFKEGSLYHKHMREQHPDVAPITTARHATASAKDNEDNDSDSANTSDASTRTLAARKAMLRNRRQEKAVEAKETSVVEPKVVKCQCPCCHVRVDSVSAMKAHLNNDHPQSAPVCHDVDRMVKWKKNYRITVCMKPACNFYCYANNVLEDHACNSLPAAPVITPDSAQDTAEIPAPVKDSNCSSTVTLSESVGVIGVDNNSSQSVSSGDTGAAADEASVEVARQSSDTDAATSAVNGSNSENVDSNESRSVLAEQSGGKAAAKHESTANGLAVGNTECVDLDNDAANSCSKEARDEGAAADSSDATKMSNANGKSSDSMYQCSFCNWITPNEPNILRHVKQEHGLSEGGYAALGLGFGDDGRVIQVVSVRDKDAPLL